MDQDIIFAEMKDEWEREYVRKKLPGHKLTFFSEPAHDIIPKLKNASALSVFINSKVSKNLIAACPHLKLVTTRSTGFDHIDLDTARERKIPVSNVPVYGENTVAEHTFALILSLSRSLRKAYLRSVQNNFSLEGLMGFDLKSKTLGVIGTGHIGLHVIRMGIGFGMKVIAFDVRKQNFLSEVMNFEYVPMEELLQRSDIISLHVPYMPATKHLINKKTIKLIKKGALLINTARGGLVETDALIEALDQGILSGAGLDVLEDEEYLIEEKRLLENSTAEEHLKKMQNTLKNHSLLHHENVIYTPHLAFYSKEAVERILDTTVENILAFNSGKPLNQVS